MRDQNKRVSNLPSLTRLHKTSSTPWPLGSMGGSPTATPAGSLSLLNLPNEIQQRILRCLVPGNYFQEDGSSGSYEDCLPLRLTCRAFDNAILRAIPTRNVGSPLLSKLSFRLVQRLMIQRLEDGYLGRNIELAAISRVTELIIRIKGYDGDDKLRDVIADFRRRYFTVCSKVACATCGYEMPWFPDVIAQAEDGRLRASQDITGAFIVAISEADWTLFNLLMKEDFTIANYHPFLGSPFPVAATINQIYMAESLLAKGFKPTLRLELGNSALVVAAVHRHYDFMEMLLKSCHLGSGELFTLQLDGLNWAAMTGNEEVVRWLLSQNVVGPSSATEQGVTPMLCAIRQEQKGIVRLFLARGDVNIDNRVLYYASQCDDKEIYLMIDEYQKTRERTG